MRAFNFGPIAKDTVSESAKLIGRGVSVKVTYTGATNLILYIANGHSTSGDDHSEIVDSTGATITRFTANGAGVQNLQINGLEPGTFIQLKSASGTGTAVMHFVTGSEV